MGLVQSEGNWRAKRLIRIFVKATADRRQQLAIHGQSKQLNQTAKPQMSFIKLNKQLEMAQSHKSEDKAGQNKRATVAAAAAAARQFASSAALQAHNSDRHD